LPAVWLFPSLTPLPLPARRQISESDVIVSFFWFQPGSPLPRPAFRATHLISASTPVFCFLSTISVACGPKNTCCDFVNCCEFFIRPPFPLPPLPLGCWLGNCRLFRNLYPRPCLPRTFIETFVIEIILEDMAARRKEFFCGLCCFFFFCSIYYFLPFFFLSPHSNLPLSSIPREFAAFLSCSCKVG